MTTMKDWRPFPGPQTDFLACTAFETLFGWMPGGGKTDGLLVDALHIVV